LPEQRCWTDLIVGFPDEITTESSMTPSWPPTALSSPGTGSSPSVCDERGPAVTCNLHRRPLHHPSGEGRV
jgi:hypothetical protein